MLNDLNKLAFQHINDQKSFYNCIWNINHLDNFQEDLVECIATKRELKYNIDYEKQLEKYCELSLKVLQDIPKAIALIEQYDQFAIVGDYDVDGITSTAQLVVLGKLLNKKTVPFIPNRFTDGYGLSDNIVNNIIAQKIPLVFTVDNGTTAYKQINTLQKNNIKIVVIDHHILQDDINIHAFINPQSMEKDNCFQNLSASGLVFFFVKAVLDHFNIKTSLDRFIGLAAIGTICDMVPLKDINRAVVREGLKALNKNRPQWIEEILQQTSVNEKNIGFIIGPILNVAGRFGVAHLSLKILTEQGEICKQILKNLQFKISQRRLIEEEVRYDICADKQGQHVRRSIPTSYTPNTYPILVNTGKIMIFAHHSWHEGVLGIVAGNMKDLFNKTVILLTKQNDQFKGSIRSVKGLHVGNFIKQLQEKNIILQGGGHEMAGGIVLKEIEKLIDFCRIYKHEIQYQKEINVDSICSLKCINNNFYDRIHQLSPFGSSNPELIFLFVKCIIVKIYQNANKNFSVFFFSHKNGNIMVPSYVNNKQLSKFLTLNRTKEFLIVGKIVRFNKKNNCQLQIIDVKIQT